MIKVKQEDIKKEVLPQLFKFIKNADNIRLEADFGTASMINRSGWRISEYNGDSTITFYLYHKKKDKRKKLMKRADK